MKDGKLLATGTTEELIKIVEGKVYTGTIPMEDLLRYEKELPIINLRNEDAATVSIRYLADCPIIPDSREVPPRLEDLYLYLFPQENKEAK